MAKDPAVLWYWNDWQGGTMTLTRHQKGCYMDLLSAQFNSGPLSLDQVKTVLGNDQASWTVLRSKFKKEVNSEGTEVFFNERMESEKQKRRAFSEKQSENGKKGGRKKSLANPTLNPDQSHYEDEDEVKNPVFEKVSLKGETFSEGAMDVDLILQKVVHDSDYRMVCEGAGYPPGKLEKWMEAFNRFLKFKGKHHCEEGLWRLGFPGWMNYHNYQNGENPEEYNPVVWSRQKKEDYDKIFKDGANKQSTGKDYSKFGKAAGTIRAGHDLSEELGINIT